MNLRSAEAEARRREMGAEEVSQLAISYRLQQQSTPDARDDLDVSADDASDQKDALLKKKRKQKRKGKKLVPLGFAETLLCRNSSSVAGPGMIEAA